MNEIIKRNEVTLEKVVYEKSEKVYGDNGGIAEAVSYCVKCRFIYGCS